MTKHVLTADDREARIERRATARQKVSDATAALRAWREDRAQAAAKRAAAERKAKAEVGARPAYLRLPEQMRDVVTPEPKPHLVSKRGNPIVTEDRPAGNHATRRLRGQRGHRRPPRRREFLGAQTMRLAHAKAASPWKPVPVITTLREAREAEQLRQAAENAQGRAS